MKKSKKNVNMMSTTKTKHQLSVFRSGSVDESGRELVIACGYTTAGEFGYFICREFKADGYVADAGYVGYMYEYSDQVAFYPKKNERTYQEVLEHLARMSTDGA